MPGSTAKAPGLEASADKRVVLCDGGRCRSAAAAADRVETAAARADFTVEKGRCTGRCWWGPIVVVSWNGRTYTFRHVYGARAELLQRWLAEAGNPPLDPVPAAPDPSDER